MDENLSISGNIVDVETPTENIENDILEQDGLDDGTNVDANVDDVLSEESLEVQEEDAPDIEKSSETVSDGDYSDGVDVDLSGSEGVVSQDYTEIITEMGILQDELKEINTSLVAINMLLGSVFFFMVFKWCEQKIKSFRRGFFKK